MCLVGTPPTHTPTHTPVLTCTYVCTCRQWYSSCDVRKLDSCVQTAAVPAGHSRLHTIGLHRPSLHCALCAVTASHCCECVRVCVVVSRLTLKCANPHVVFPRDLPSIHVLVNVCNKIDTVHCQWHISIPVMFAKQWGMNE